VHCNGISVSRIWVREGKTARTLRESESERDYLQSTHIYVWKYSSHDRLSGRGVPGMLLISRLCAISLFGLPQREMPRSPYDDTGGRGVLLPSGQSEFTESDIPEHTQPGPMVACTSKLMGNSAGLLGRPSKSPGATDTCPGPGGHRARLWPGVPAARTPGQEPESGRFGRHPQVQGLTFRSPPNAFHALWGRSHLLSAPNSHFTSVLGQLLWHEVLVTYPAFKSRQSPKGGCCWGREPS